MASNHSRRDGYFRSMLSYPDIIWDFVRYRLPPLFLKGFELGRVELLPTSVLKAALTNSTMDIVMKLTNRHQQQRLIIVEHQSQPERMMTVRLLMYQVDLIREHLKTFSSLGKSNTRLPLFLACIYYSGVRQPYPYSMNIRDAFDEGQTEHLVCNHIYPIISVTDLPTDAHYKTTRLFMVEGILCYTSQKQYESLANHIISFNCLSDMPLDMRGQTWQYILSELSQDQLQVLVNRLTDHHPNVKGEIMSYADVLIQQGIEKGTEIGKLIGLEEGKSLGRQEGAEIGSFQARTNIAKQLLATGLNLDLIAKCTGFTKEQLIEFQNQG